MDQSQRGARGMKRNLKPFSLAKGAYRNAISCARPLGCGCGGGERGIFFWNWWWVPFFSFFAFSCRVLVHHQWIGVPESAFSSNSKAADGWRNKKRQSIWSQGQVSLRRPYFHLCWLDSLLPLERQVWARNVTRACFPCSFTAHLSRVSGPYLAAEPCNLVDGLKTNELS